MHPEWLSNAYLVWDEGSREAFFVDSGGPLEPLLEVVEREGLEVKALLTTHTHGDHVAGDAELERRFGVRGTQEVDWAQSIATPGHADDHVTFVVDGLCFSGDLLFKDAVGGGDAARVHESVLKLMELPDETRVLPGPHRGDDDRARARGEPVPALLARRRAFDRRAGARGRRRRDARRLVAGLRRQGQGARPVRATAPSRSSAARGSSARRATIRTL